MGDPSAAPRCLGPPPRSNLDPAILLPAVADSVPTATATTRPRLQPRPHPVTREAPPQRNTSPQSGASCRGASCPGAPTRVDDTRRRNPTPQRRA